MSRLDEAEALAAAERIDTPPGYEGWSAAQKHEWLWNTLICGTEPTEAWLPPLVLPFQRRPLTELGIVLRKPQLEKALTRTSDVMEPGRPKIIHAGGAAAMIELDTTDASPFSGLLAAPAAGGGATGLIRMSLVTKVSGKKSHIPAMALKLLVDRHPSADLLAMNHTVGQGRDFDMFSNSMTNDLSEEHRELRTSQKVMARLFARVSSEPRRLTAAHLTARRRDGSAVDAPVTPDRLVFRPTREAKRIFAGKADVDFRRVLRNVGAGVPLYEVEGLVGAPDARTVESVGVVRTSTSFVSSPGGDRVFFRHVQDQ